jgi:hypothetical protein
MKRKFKPIMTFKRLQIKNKNQTTISDLRDIGFRKFEIAKILKSDYIFIQRGYR